jgi:hypothetical protein
MSPEDLLLKIWVFRAAVLRCDLIMKALISPVDLSLGTKVGQEKDSSLIGVPCP